MPQPAPAPTALTNLDVNPATVAGGDASSGTVIVSVSAPDTTVISLSSSNPAVASVPATVTVPTGGFTGTFTIATSPVASTTGVVITATLNGSSRSATLTVTDGQAPSATSLQNLVLSPDERHGRHRCQAALVLVGRGAPDRRRGLALEQQPRGGGRARERDGVRRWHVDGGRHLDLCGEQLHPGDDHGDVRRRDPHRGPHRDPERAPAAERDDHAHRDRAQRRTGHLEPGRASASPPGAPARRRSPSGRRSRLTASDGRSTVWSGACSSGGNKVRTCTFTVSGPGSVTANVQ